MDRNDNNGKKRNNIGLLDILLVIIAILATIATALAVANFIDELKTRDRDTEICEQVDDRRTIFVEGTATATIEADTAIFSATVSFDAPTGAEASMKANEALGALLDALDGIGVPKEDIHTSSIRLSKWTRYIDSSNREELLKASYELGIEVSLDADEKALAEVVDAIAAIDGTEISGMEFIKKDSSAEMDMLIADAVRDAESKARNIANVSMPESDIKAVSFSLNSSNESYWLPASGARLMSASMKADSAALSLPESTSEISASVSATFEVVGKAVK